MKAARFIKDRFRGLTGSVNRFPLTVAFLAAAAVCIAIQVSTHRELNVWILSCAVGAAACAAGQAAEERFTFRGARLLFSLAGVLLAVVHFLLIRRLDPDGIETAVRTVVLIFTLFIALVRIAVTRSGHAFHEGFMATFKALFQSLLFSAVIMGGCSAIIAAIDLLISPVDSDAYTHVANVVFVLFAPIFFLSMFPRFPVRKKGAGPENGAAEAVIRRRIACPKFFEILLSDIVIPLASVYTVILLLYIILNIGGRFWSDNRLEPMLVSYTIVVIVVTLLVSGLDNRLARLFRTVFPKVLIPIALFQTAASLLILADSGITFSRYYVILYGVFAVCSGVVLSVSPVRKTGLVALLLIVFSVISLTPPADAFTVSRRAQINTLERVLTENNMLTEGSVVPNDAVSDADKKTVASAVEYLSRMDDLDKVAWLPDDFDPYNNRDFFAVFGFDLYDVPIDGYRSVYVELNPSAVVPVDGYDYFTQLAIASDGGGDTPAFTVRSGGMEYSLSSEKVDDWDVLVLKDENGGELIRFDTKDVFTRYKNAEDNKTELTLEEATFISEGDQASLFVIVRNAGISAAPDETYYNAQLLLFIKFG